MPTVYHELSRAVLNSTRLLLDLSDMILVYLNVRLSDDYFVVVKLSADEIIRFASQKSDTDGRGVQLAVFNTRLFECCMYQGDEFDNTQILYVQLASDVQSIDQWPPTAIPSHNQSQPFDVVFRRQMPCPSNTAFVINVDDINNVDDRAYILEDERRVVTEGIVCTLRNQKQQWVIKMGDNDNINIDPESEAARMLTLQYHGFFDDYYFILPISTDLVKLVREDDKHMFIETQDRHRLCSINMV